MINCDWCGGRMRRIGAVETGMLLGHASVWLCWCGHEREVFDTTLPLWWWRDQLVFLLFCRFVDETHRTWIEQWEGIRAQHDAAVKRARELLSSETTPSSRAPSTTS